MKSFNQKDSIISILQDRLDIADQHQADAKAHLERYDVLQMQLQMYKDDPLSERRDRERAWERIDQLEKQLRLTTQQVIGMGDTGGCSAGDWHGGNRGRCSAGDCHGEMGMV